jgi:hypothetical protein
VNGSIPALLDEILSKDLAEPATLPAHDRERGRAGPAAWSSASAAASRSGGL